MTDAYKAGKDNAALQGKAGAVKDRGTFDTMQAGLEVVTSDMQTLANDAATYASAVQHKKLVPPTGFDLVGWQRSIKAAITSLGEARSAAASFNPQDFMPAVDAAKAAVTAVYNAVNASPGVSAFHGTSTFHPNPRATPSYILLPHASWHQTTLSSEVKLKDAPPGTPPKSPTVDGYITSGHEKHQTHDATALDFLDKTAYPDGVDATIKLPAPPAARPPDKTHHLAQGSDVKIVGGDNVTLVANDARSQVQGHAYGMVQAGQTSVVYAPGSFAGAVTAWNNGPAAQSDQDRAAQLRQRAAAIQVPPEPMRQANETDTEYDLRLASYDSLPSVQLKDKLEAQADALDAKAQSLVGMAPARPPAPPWDWNTIAQVSAAYGNVRAWTDGNTDATVTGDTKSTIDGSATTTIKNWRNTYVNGSTKTVLGTDLGNSHNTTVMGNRALELSGSDSSLFVGAKASLVAGADTAACVGAKTSIVVGLKTDITAAARVSVTAGPDVHHSPTRVEDAILHVYQSLLTLDVAATRVIQGEMFLSMHELHTFF